MKLLYHPSSTGDSVPIATERYPEVTNMSRYEDACPFDEQTRANRCRSCVATNAVPPCAAAFLTGRAPLPADNVIQLRRIEIVPSIRKAA